MCDYCENEDRIEIQCEFNYIDECGNSTHVCKSQELFDEETELPQLLENFRLFLHQCGFVFVDKLQVICRNGNVIDDTF